MEFINRYSVFYGVKYFHDDGSQNFLIFEPISRTFRMSTDGTETVRAWKSNGFSEEY